MNFHLLKKLANQSFIFNLMKFYCTKNVFVINRLIQASYVAWKSIGECSGDGLCESELKSTYCHRERVSESACACKHVRVCVCVCVCVGKSVRYNTQLRWDKHYQNKWLWMSLWNRWMGILGGSKVGRDKTLRLRWLCQYFFMTGRIFVDWKLPEEPNHGLVVRAVTCRARWPRLSPKCYFFLRGAMVVAQLAEQLLPTPEIRGLNPDIGNQTFRTYVWQLLSRKDVNKEKEAGILLLTK